MCMSKQRDIIALWGIAHIQTRLAGSLSTHLGSAYLDKLIQKLKAPVFFKKIDILLCKKGLIN